MTKHTNARYVYGMVLRWYRIIDRYDAGKAMHHSLHHPHVAAQNLRMYRNLNFVAFHCARKTHEDNKAKPVINRPAILQYSRWGTWFIARNGATRKYYVRTQPQDGKGAVSQASHERMRRLFKEADTGGYKAHPHDPDDQLPTAVYK